MFFTTLFYKIVGGVVFLSRGKLPLLLVYRKLQFTVKLVAVG
jgi:hypothetical protein